MEGSSNIPSDLAWIDLTSTQLPVWLDLGSGAHPSSYVIGGYIRIPGPVDPERFIRAVDVVVARNDALRLRFDVKEPRQIIDFSDYPCVDIVDVSAAPDPNVAFRSYLETEFPKPFDLAARGRLFRISLIRLEAGLWYCVLKFHHLVADGMSISLVFGQICDVYNGDADGARRHPAYLDFARDDAAYLASERYRRDLDYWRERFRSAPRPLFSERRRAGRRDDRGVAPALTWQLPWARYKALTELGKSRGVTPFAIFLGVLAATLMRMRGTPDLVIGVPVLNRSAASWRDTIGMFAGAMPTRLRLPRRATLHDITALAAAQLRRDFRHQRAPISDIVRALGMPQQGQWRLFDVVLSFEPNDYDLRLDGAAVQASGHVSGYEFNPLAVYVREYNSDRPVAIDFVFNPNFLAREEAADLQRRFQFLLERYLGDPDQRLADIDIVTAEETVLQRQDEIVASTMVREEASSIVSLIEAQVGLRPEAVAVEGSGERLSYGALWARSGLLAARLRALG
ncbi:MAG TPA: condensation domain-containing protein, partial [Stellaceae bacterium]|nr:condensation domain-containing protein [Stellaceae bacterium]